MNRRIQELAEQASHQSPDGYPVTIPYSKDFAEKFAELIVMECQQICNSFSEECSPESHAEAIGQHFSGVDE